MAEEDAVLLIRAAALVDGLGGPPVAPALLAAQGRHIVYAGRPEAAPPFPGARTVDLPGATLLPGLVDLHVHTTYCWNEPDAAAYSDEDEGRVAYTPAHLALLAASRLTQALAAGVTSVRDCGAVAAVLPAVRHARERGAIGGSRLAFAGRIIIPTGGHLHHLAGLVNEADGPDGFRRAVRQEAAAGADFVKVANNAADLTPAELAAAVDEAHRLGLQVAGHTADPPSWRMALQAGVDTIEHGAPTEREIDQALAQGTTWVPTLNITAAFLDLCDRRRSSPDPLQARQAEAQYAATAGLRERQQAAVAYALRAGLRLAAGTDAWLPGVPFASLAAELRCLVECGATPLQAIQAATAGPARAMGWAGRGVLESGAFADLIAVAGDPLADIGALEHVELVVLDGQVLRG